MTALAVILPDAVYGHDLLPGKGIDQTGLTHAGRTQKHYCLSWLQVGVQPFQAIAGMGADHMGVHSDSRAVLTASSILFFPVPVPHPMRA